MLYRCLACLTEYDGRISWCWTCGGPGLVAPAGRRPPSALDGRFEMASAQSLVARQWRSVPLGSYPSLRIMKGALVVLFGGPAQGKSTMLCRALDGISGPVVMVAAEENLGPAVGSRLARLGIKRADFVVVAGGRVDDVVAEAVRRSAKVVGIDSVTAVSMTPRDLRRLVSAADLDALIVTAQVTKVGTVRGTHELLHEADVVVAVRDGRWAVEKTRYQASGTAGSVLEPVEAVA